MKLSEIQRAVVNRVEGASGLVPVIHDRTGDGNYEHGGELYAKVFIVTLDNREPVYCDSVLRSGFIVANVYAPNGYGSAVPTEEAEKFAELFPEGLKFGGITTPNEPDIRSPADSEQAGWFYVHTRIYFEA